MFPNSPSSAAAGNVLQPLLVTMSSVQSVARETGRSLTAVLHEIESRCAWSEVAAAMDDHLSRLAATECWGKENPLPSSVFWKEAGDTLQRGSLQAHARFKPHGYAGDFEMLDRLVRQDVRGEGLEQAFDRYFQHHPAPRAVRNRTQWVADKLLEVVATTAGDQPVRVVSVGSGPAADIHLALQTMDRRERSRLRVCLLDLDANGLEFARRRLTDPAHGGLDEQQLELRRENLFRLPRRDDDPSLRAELIVCTGLFDYLPDADAEQLLRWLERHRAPGGTLVMMNFSPDNGSRAYMEWAGMWYLIHRTEAEMRALAQRADFGTRWELTAEPSGIDLILTRV
ncbi:MAG: class I SAM-dependent methyltransferase [Planctomycetales bacterium]|nr:class I SAM-dependent methyltransferase [Planctomycetales bacterium]